MPDEFPYDVFLSHSAKDKAVVRPLAERLRKDGLKVWFDEWVLKPGDSIPAKIEEGLEHSRVLVLCMSANAFGSDWAQLEAGTFRFRDPLNKERRFIPLRLDDAPIKGSLAQFLYINWLPTVRNQEYSKLLGVCRGEIELIETGGHPTNETMSPTIEAVPQSQEQPLKTSSPLEQNESVESVAKDSLFEVIAPTCILDVKHERVPDWNPAFEVIFPTNGFRRGDHIDKWIEGLANAAEMKALIRGLFARTHGLPTIEPKATSYTSSNFGHLEFTMCSSQVTFPNSGRHAAWVLNFDIDATEERSQLLTALQRTFQDHRHWRLYAQSYDPILTNFDPYLNFVKQHLEALKPAGSRILDLGAGTGNLTLELLRAGKKVYAIDHSDAMLGKLRLKCGENKNLRIIKQNIETTEVFESLGEISKYDGIALLNVLFALKDPRRCLEMCHQYLTRGGILVFSGPRSDVNLNRLLDEIGEYLQTRKLWDRFRDHYQIVRARNEYMDTSNLLKQFSTDEQVKTLESIGFTVTKVIANGYCGDDMIIEAIKK